MRPVTIAVPANADSDKAAIHVRLWGEQTRWYLQLLSFRQPETDLQELRAFHFVASPSLPHSSAHCGLGLHTKRNFPTLFRI